MKKKATKAAKPRDRKGLVRDLEPKADPTGGKVQMQDIHFTIKVDKATPVLGPATIKSE